MNNMVEPEAVLETQVNSISAEPSEAADYAGDIPSGIGISGLSEELRMSKTLGSFKDVDSLAKSYLHLNGLLGKKFEDLSPSELEGYYAKLGRPQNPEEYTLPEKYDPQVADWYKKQAHELGLTQQQARNLAEKYADLEGTRIEDMKAKREEQAAAWVAEIKQEFGSAFDQRIETARKAVQEYGGPELRQYLDDTGLGNNPSLIKAFAKIGKELSEGTMAQAESVAQFGHTPAEAAQRIAELHRDPSFMRAYNKASAPGHEAAVQEMLKWNEIKYSE